MRRMILFLIAVLLAASCDVSSVFDGMNLFPERDEKKEYTLQSGNPYFYFGTAMDEIVFEDGVLEADGNAYPLKDGVIMLAGGYTDVLVSGNCITLSLPGVDPLVFVSL